MNKGQFIRAEKIQKRLESLKSRKETITVMMRDMETRGDKVEIKVCKSPSLEFKIFNYSELEEVKEILVNSLELIEVSIGALETEFEAL